VAAFFLTRLMSSLLFGVDARDITTYSVVALFLAVVSLLASYLPEQRAASVQPLDALRWECHRYFVRHFGHVLRRGEWLRQVDALEALAAGCGFNPEGGNRNHSYGLQTAQPALAPHLKMEWSPKITQGFFLRAESFFNFATYVDELNLGDAYGGRSLHKQSHGESFLSLFTSRFKQGVFIFRRHP